MLSNCMFLLQSLVVHSLTYRPGSISSGLRSTERSYSFIRFQSTHSCSNRLQRNYSRISYACESIGYDFTNWRCRKGSSGGCRGSIAWSCRHVMRHGSMKYPPLPRKQPAGIFETAESSLTLVRTTRLTEFALAFSGMFSLTCLLGWTWHITPNTPKIELPTISHHGRDSFLMVDAGAGWTMDSALRQSHSHGGVLRFLESLSDDELRISKSMASLAF